MDIHPLLNEVFRAHGLYLGLGTIVLSMGLPFACDRLWQRLRVRAARAGLQRPAERAAERIALIGSTGIAMGWANGSAPALPADILARRDGAPQRAGADPTECYLAVPCRLGGASELTVYRLIPLTLAQRPNL